MRKAEQEAEDFHFIFPAWKVVAREERQDVAE